MGTITVIITILVGVILTIAGTVTMFKLSLEHIGYWLTGLAIILIGLYVIEIGFILAGWITIA